jgi:hypothetical protein
MYIFLFVLTLLWYIYTSFSVNLINNADEVCQNGKPTAKCKA